MDETTMIKQVEHYGHVVTLSIVYDTETFIASYEVTRRLTDTNKTILSRCVWNDKSDADKYFDDLVIEMGAIDYNDFLC